MVALISTVSILALVLAGLSDSLKTGNWDWTGFREYTTKITIERDPAGNVVKTIEENQSAKTLWDGVQLAGTVAVPLILGIGGYLLNQREKKREQRRAEAREEQELLRLEMEYREQALQAYFNRMFQLLDDKELGNKTLKENPARDIARVRTLTVLKSLGTDGQRKKAVLEFLYGCELINGLYPLMSLENADLRGAELSEANLENAIFTRAPSFLMVLTQTEQE